MAEAAITAIAKSALQLFSPLAKDEFLLLWKSGKELKRLENTIETISCLLYDTNKLQSQEKSVQNCLSRLRDAMYDAEEFFDALHWRVLHKKTMGESVVFPKEELIRLWLSQGFIKPADKDESLEELGEKYFFHLVERCFFQEIERPKVTPCNAMRYVYHHLGNHLYGHRAIMHDLLHDVAINVAKTEFISLGKVTVNEGERISHRHIYVGGDGHADSLDHHCSLISDPKRVKTLLLQKTSKSLDFLLGRFKMLRTLNLSFFSIPNISDCIGELIHLRYLNLSYNDQLKYLPNSICNLHHLLILDLTECELLESLPPKIEKLVSLRQLYLYECDKLDSLPSGLATLTSLVELDRLIVHPDSGGLGYLSGLDNLRGY